MSSSSQTVNLLPIDQALRLIQQVIEPIDSTQLCNLDQVLNRVLAKSIVSPINVPAYDNSAMDGYAVIANDLNKTDRLQLVGSSFAGKPYSGKLQTGQAVRIMTGAMLPGGADTVVMQENTQLEGQQVLFKQQPSIGDAVRLTGSDIQQGSEIIAKGKRLSAVDIGLLASLGIAQVEVMRKIKVAVLSTGDELVAPGQPLGNSQIYDSNRAMITALVTKLGAEVMDFGIVPDDLSALRRVFTLADQQADCVITSGGVSVGEADLTKQVLAELGQVDFWKLAIKPGKPLAFGRLPHSVFFGLPGNPTSALITFDQIVVPALNKLANGQHSPAIELQALADQIFKKRPGRTDFQRAYCWVDDSGQLKVKAVGSQSSGVLSNFTQSNCYAVLAQPRSDVQVGESVSVVLFDDWLK